MTIKELSQALNQIVGVRIETFTIPMRIMDVKTSYGIPRFLVQPLKGEGEQWVEMSRFSKLDESQANEFTALLEG